MAQIGSFALLLALALSAYSFLAGILALTGIVGSDSDRLGETARRAGIATFATVLLAAIILVVSAFHDDFSKRSQPFIEVLKKAQSKSVGTITEAGLESQSGDEALVMVAVSVVTTNVGEPDSEPRHWRMRVSVKKVGDEAKVSNVAFVQ